MTTSERRLMAQSGPYPEILREIVESLETYPGWKFRLSHITRDIDSNGQTETEGLTLIIQTLTYNSYHPEDGINYKVNHYFPVPAATYNRRSWIRWVFEQLMRVQLHEMCEFFKIGGERPYAPTHGPGDDPYVITEIVTELAHRTQYTGEVLPPKDERIIA